eukprot:2844767-Pyramimonas_sp.AAC.1
MPIEPPPSVRGSVVDLLSGGNWSPMARRKAAISAANFDRSAAASLDVGTSPPRSPAVASVPADWSWTSSQSAQCAAVSPHPAAGPLELALRPRRMSLTARPWVM